MSEHLLVDSSEEIDEALVLHEALKIKLKQEMTKAQRVIARFLRRRQEKIKYRFFRRINLFDATIYLESNALDGGPI